MALNRVGGQLSLLISDWLEALPGHSPASMFWQLAEGSDLQRSNESLVIVLIDIIRQRGVFEHGVDLVCHDLQEDCAVSCFPNQA